MWSCYSKYEHKKLNTTKQILYKEYKFCACILDWIVLEIKYKQARRFSSCLFICNIHLWTKVVLWMCVYMWGCASRNESIDSPHTKWSMPYNEHILLLFEFRLDCGFALRDEDDKHKCNSYSYVYSYYLALEKYKVEIIIFHSFTQVYVL